MWEDDFENEEYERLMYDYESSIYCNDISKTSKTRQNRSSSNSYYNSYSDDYNSSSKTKDTDDFFD